MALDGDTDFHPAAVILLVDRLRMYENVGAACGRIHPTGMGEDRWLCTLLLQQGWRVEYNAASDAYTNAPQEFKEFYNQRRRWGPSTLANTLDLLHSGRETAKRNSSISMLYIFYQIFTVGSSILGPASVSLMVAGAFQFVFQMEGTLAIAVSIIPPIVYMVICFTCKPNLQITIAGILSVLYAFLMTASFFSIIGDMVIQGTFITPTGIFLVSMTILYLVTAILHPQEFSMIIYGLMYFICIPSGYLLLTIYSLVNMHIVSWGTRESNRDKAEGKTVGLLCDRNCKLCCWDLKLQVTQQTTNATLLQIQNTLDPNARSAKMIVTQAQTQGVQENPRTVQSEQQAVENNQQGIQHKTTSFKRKQVDAKKLPKDECDSRSEGSSESKESSDVKDDDYESLHYDDDDQYDDDQYDNDLYDDKEEVVPESDWVVPVKTEFLKKLTYSNMKRNLQEQIRYSLRNKNQEDVCEELVMMLTDTVNGELKDRVGPEDVLTDSQLEELQYALNETARRILKTNRMERLERRVKRAVEKTLTAPQVEKLTEDEHDFWKKLIERYLTPIVDEKAHKDEVTRELKSLRNKATFLYFILNVLWVVATFFLQAIGDTISIKFPKYFPNGTKSDETMNVEPLSLMFLLSFAVLLLIQFLAMIYHRIYTLIHVVSYRSTEKDYKVKDEEDEDEGLTLENYIANGLVITSDDL
ncbi:hypothetical protein AAFF_G00215200 [Aldrovandia affinis]|uniref:chitin synthase n=1 Tax=Aldrovandia affinis TaxID=143900 RepID=A0AAD7RGA6_9TELE|nr:hypothetical protein AAFF_G00215200 [Aldrovandia affinis]